MAPIPDQGLVMKTMTLRLDDERAATLELMARAENKTVTDAVRTAIDEHIDARRPTESITEYLLGAGAQVTLPLPVNWLHSRAADC